MLNIFSFICSCLNFSLHSSSFFFAKLPESYAFLNPSVDFMPVIPVFFFSLSLCLASFCKFLMRSLFNIVL